MPGRADILGIQHDPADRPLAELVARGGNAGVVHLGAGEQALIICRSPSMELHALQAAGSTSDVQSGHEPSSRTPTTASVFVTGEGEGRPNLKRLKAFTDFCGRTQEILWACTGLACQGRISVSGTGSGNVVCSWIWVPSDPAGFTPCQECTWSTPILAAALPPGAAILACLSLSLHTALPPRKGRSRPSQWPRKAPGASISKADPAKVYNNGLRRHPRGGTTWAAVSSPRRSCVQISRTEQS